MTVSQLVEIKCLNQIYLLECQDSILGQISRVTPMASEASGKRMTAISQTKFLSNTIHQGGQTKAQDKTQDTSILTRTGQTNQTENIKYKRYSMTHKGVHSWGVTSETLHFNKLTNVS